MRYTHRTSYNNNNNNEENISNNEVNAKLYDNTDTLHVSAHR